MKTILIMIVFTLVLMGESYVRGNLSVNTIFFYIAYIVGGITALVIEKYYVNKRW